MSNRTKYSTLTAMLMLAGSISAHAMLPTPEVEMNNPTSATNAALIQQNTRNSNDAENVNANSMPVNNTATDSNSQSQSDSIQTKTVALLVGTDDQGRSTLQPVNASTQLKSGDTVEYHTYLTNNSGDRVQEMTVSMTIPDELKLVGEVTPDSASASVDGKNFNRMPLRGNIDGVTQDIPLEYYKALSWKLKGLGVDETAVVKYRATVR